MAGILPAPEDREQRTENRTRVLVFSVLWLLSSVLYVEEAMRPSIGLDAWA
jgi:hypothetical protein